MSAPGLLDDADAHQRGAADARRRLHSSSGSPVLRAPVPPPMPSTVSKVEQCKDDLLLTSLQPSVVPMATGAIINLMFFSEPHRFFSYTHTQDELSLLLDVKTALTFPPGMLSVGPGAWRILEIQEGSEIIDTPGIVSSLCAPLFEQQRVEELLYLSTFVSDLILVRERHIDIAETIVGNNLHFLVESRRKVQEAMALAEEEEREAERRRIQMEEEDMKRANEEGETTAEGELDSSISDGPHAADALRIPLPSRDDQLLPPSMASSLSSGTDIFHFSLQSSASTLSTMTTQAAPTATTTIPSRSTSIERDHRFTAPPPSLTPIIDLHQMSMEPEGPEGEAAVDMHLSMLPFRLVLLTFHAKYLPQCTFAILHALMRGSSSGVAAAASSADGAPAAAAVETDATVPAHLRPSFFSFTQAGTQVSLIVEASCLPLFPAHIVTPHKSVWNALQVSQGTESSDPAALVAPISSILAKVGVSIYYLSTFNLDYILVAEKEIQLALEALAQTVNVMVDS